MDEAIKNHEFYQRCYSDGYREGFSKALESYESMIMNRTKPIIISKEYLTTNICKGKCYLYNTEHCNIDGLSLTDVTTCKNYHTEESFNAINKLNENRKQE